MPLNNTNLSPFNFATHGLEDPVVTLHLWLQIFAILLTKGKLPIFSSTAKAEGKWKTHSALVVPSRAILRYYRCDRDIARYLFREESTPPKWCGPPAPLLSFAQAQLCDTQCCNMSRDNCARSPPPPETSTKSFCDTIATSIARYESIATGPLRTVRAMDVAPLESSEYIMSLCCLMPSMPSSGPS